MTDLIAHDFIATEVSRDENRIQYEVRGHVRCNTTGYQIELEPINEGIVPTPESAALQMVVTEPSGAVHETETAVEVNYSGRDGLELRTVGVRLVRVRSESGADSIPLSLMRG